MVGGRYDSPVRLVHLGVELAAGMLLDRVIDLAEQRSCRRLTLGRGVPHGATALAGEGRDRKRAGCRFKSGARF
jgi:hypothetical protein